jgi:group I intron endonuclease
LGVVYLLTNLVTGHYYIGQTRDFAKRKRQHLRARGDHSYPINRAIRKYGAGNFDFSILGEAPVGDELNVLEQLLIITANATEKGIGYNLRMGGSVATFNEETRARMSAACKLRPPRSAESRQKASESMKGKKFPEHSIRMKGRIKSQETCKRLSESLKGHVISEETKAKISRTLLAKKLTMPDDHRAKVSAAAKKRWKLFRANGKGKSNVSIPAV